MRRRASSFSAPTNSRMRTYPRARPRERIEVHEGATWRGFLNGLAAALGNRHTRVASSGVRAPATSNTRRPRDKRAKDWRAHPRLSDWVTKPLFSHSTSATTQTIKRGWECPIARKGLRSRSNTSAPGHLHRMKIKCRSHHYDRHLQVICM